VLREKASDVIEDFFLALCTWQHVISVEDDSNSNRGNLNGQAIFVLIGDSFLF
jgi:hypothetical protein